MKKDYFSLELTCFYRCWRYGILFPFLALTLMITPDTSTAQTGNIQGIAPVISPTNGTAIDGNAYANWQKNDTIISGVLQDWSTSGDIFYWEQLYPGPGAGVLDVIQRTPPQLDTIIAPMPYTPLVDKDTVIVFRDGIGEFETSVYEPGTKINGDPNTYHWLAKPVLAKNEIQNAGILFTWGDPSLKGIDGEWGDPNDLWCAFAADRQAITGSSFIEIEVLQNKMWLDSIPVGNDSGSFHSNGPHGGRTIGDYGVTVEFTQGGAEANVIVTRWTYDGLDNKGDSAFSYHEVPSSLVDPVNGYPYGSILATVNTEKTYVHFPAFGQIESVTLDKFNYDGTANGDTTLTLPFYQVNQWCEGAFNISALFELNANPCFVISTVNIRTKTSGSSDQANVVDFPGPPIQLNITADPPVAHCPGDSTYEACVVGAEAKWDAWKNEFYHVSGSGKDPVLVTIDGDTIPDNLPTDYVCEGFSTTVWITVVDDCGKQDSCAATFTIAADDQPPTLEGTLPTGQTGISGCIEDAPDGPTAAAIAALYSDDCGNVNVNKTGSPTGDDCSWSVTYVFSIKDDCENYADTVSITYSGGDDQPPTLEGTLPTGQTGISGCIEDAPDGPTAAAIAALYADDCGSVNVNKTGSPTGDDCSWSVTYVYSIKDDCENYADTVRITYSGADDQPPTLEGTLPTGQTGISGCIEDAPDGPTAAAIAALYADDCGSVNVNKTGSPTGDDCAWSVTYVFSIKDDCENYADTVRITYSGGDDQPPTLEGTLPTGETGISGCIEDAPDGPTAAAIAALYADDCGSVNVNKTGSPTGDDCSWSVTYVFSIKDDCENYADTVRITYSGGDDQPPTLEGTLPTGQTGISGCIEDAPDGPTAATIAALYSDDCGNVNVNKTGSPTGDDCSWSVTYVFSIKDDCENYADTVRITYSGGDDQPPMITCPANVELACDELPNITLPTATDNCDDSVDVTWKRSDDATGLNDPVTPGATVTVTVYANDGCNIDSCQFTITAEECGPHIFPTGTECYNYNNCSDDVLDTYNLDYICVRTDKDDVIDKSVPGAMIYFTHLTLPAGTSQIQVKQANDCGLTAFNTISLDVKLYDANCMQLTSGVSASESGGVVTVDVTGATAGDYVLYVKYDPKTIIGQTLPNWTSSSSCEYEFTTEIDGSYAIGSYGTLELRSCNSPARYTIVDCQAPSVESATVQQSESLTTESLKSTNLKVYPNPFSETVTFEFTTHSNAHATLEITNLLGQKVATLLDGPVEGGVLNRLEYTPVNETPGMLIYRLIINESVQTGRIIYQN